jgi:hypothetical protein
VVSEVSVNVAGALEVRHRQAKFGNIRRALGNARRDIVASEEPDTDICRSPFGDVDTTVVVAQSFTIVVWGRSVVCHASTSRIVVGSAVAVSTREQASLVGTSNGAICIGVHGNSVGHAGVHTLDDI